jgi:hypothetical protein
MPKKLDEHWAQITPEEHETHLNRMGNLVLLKSEDNGRIQGKAYSFKKTVFSITTNPTLTIEAGTSDKWGVQEIEHRQKRLAEIAVRTWPIK